MDDAWQEFLLNLLAYAIVGGVSGVVLGALFLAMPPLRRRLLPLPRLRPGRWSGAEVLLAMFALPLAQFAVLSVLVATATPERDPDAAQAEAARLIVLGSPVWTALTLAVVTTLLFAISRTRPHQYGMTWARWPANVVLGILLFLVLAPLTLAVYVVVVLAFGSETNPLELAAKRGFSEWEWALLVFMTVAGAPLTEEVLFRGVLQGWLRRATLIGHIALLLIVLVGSAWPLMRYVALQLAEVGEHEVVLHPPAPSDWISAIVPLVFFTVLVAGYACWLWRLGRRHLHTMAEVWLWRPGADLLLARPAADADGDAQADDDKPAAAVALDDSLLPARQQAWAWANARLAIFGSAMLFGLFHGWPNAVPLMLFGIGLGWLASRTQSVIGTIVCHALFNCVACIVLALGT